MYGICCETHTNKLKYKCVLLDFFFFLLLFFFSFFNGARHFCHGFYIQHPPNQTVQNQPIYIKNSTLPQSYSNTESPIYNIINSYMPNFIRTGKGEIKYKTFVLIFCQVIPALLENLSKYFLCKKASKRKKIFKLFNHLFEF